MLYTLRVTFLRPGTRRGAVQNVKDLTWADARMLEDILTHERSTVRVDITLQTPAWAK